MRLLRKQFYLRYAASPEVAETAFSLTLTTNLKSLLRDWGPTTRISPVWRVVPDVPNAEPGDRESTTADILFLSGISPDWLAGHLAPVSLALLGDDSILLTLGVFSLVVISCFEDVTAELLDLCTRHDVAYEHWQCSEPPEIGRTTEKYTGTEIDRVNPVEFKLAGQRSLTKVSRSLFDHATIEADDTVGLMALELYALLAVVESRATGNFAVLSQDCIQIEAMVTQLTSVPDLVRKDNSATNELIESLDLLRLPDANPQDLLLTLNAALSRLASQALSGTSPITQTECHFWPHSFLAIGVACLALRNVAAFITRAVSLADFNGRYNRLLALPAQWDADQVSGATTDLPAYLDQKPSAAANLRGHANSATEQVVVDPDDELTPTPITYYSGRDGFRNDPLTMSAPLPSVSGCNSHQWNLGTITHELSHRILSGKIEKLLEGILRRMDELGVTTKERVKGFYDEAPSTVRDQAERLLGFTLAGQFRKTMDPVKWDKRVQTPGLLFRDAKERYGVMIEETLVHIFDFYHFYGANSKYYVDFVWLSWAVQPMIARRQDEYIKRTLTALSVKHFPAENWIDLAIEDFQTVLREAPLADRLTMQATILTALSGSGRDRYVIHLKRMRHLIELFYLIFKSDVLATIASSEAFRSPKSSGPRGSSRSRRRLNYSATQLIFPGGDPAVPEIRFTNPLLFLRDYSQSHQPRAAEAAWVLHMLAFNYLPEPGERPA